MTSVSVLAIMAICMPASTIDINSPTWLPLLYTTQDNECPCGNSGRIGGVWLNYYSPCRCDSTTMVLVESLPLPPLREDPLDTQLHQILHPSVYAPSLNPGYFGLHHSAFAPLGNLIHLNPLDHYFDQADISFKIDARRFIGGRGFADPATVPEPATLVLLAIGVAFIAKRRKRPAA